MSSLTKSSSTSSGRIGVPRKDWLNTTDTDMDMFGEVLNDRLSAWPLLLGSLALSSSKDSRSRDLAPLPLPYPSKPQGGGKWPVPLMPWVGMGMQGS